MAEHNFEPLFENYPNLIQDMNDTFTSHEFILHLAQQYQDLYVTALYTYINLPNPQHPTPFKIVHGILAKHLHDFPQLLTHVGEVESINIFTQENRCARWHKI